MRRNLNRKGEVWLTNGVRGYDFNHPATDFNQSPSYFNHPSNPSDWEALPLGFAPNFLPFLPIPSHFPLVPLPPVPYQFLPKWNRFPLVVMKSVNR